MLVSIEANTKKLENQMAKSEGIVNKRMGHIEKRVIKSGGVITNGLGNVLTGVIAALGINEVRQYADAWTETGNRLLATGTAVDKLADKQDRLVKLAMDTRSVYEPTVDLYTKLTRSTEKLGISQGIILRTTELVNKSFKSSGAETAQVSAGILQLGQALESGVLQGDELRSIRENAPLLAKAIADYFGVTVGELKKLGAEGRITADKIIAAINAAGPEIEKQFAATRITVNDALTNLQTGLTQYIGKIDTATGASASIAGLINSVATNFDDVGNSAAVAGAAILAATGPKALTGVTRLGVGMTAALGPFGLVAGGIAGLGVALGLFGDDVKLFENDIASLADYTSAIWSYLKDGGIYAAKALEAAFVESISLITQMIGGVSVSMSDILSSIKTVLNSMIGAFVFARDNIYNNWATLPRAIGELTIGMVNKAIDAVEKMMNGVIYLINNLVRQINMVSGAVSGFTGIDLGKVGVVGKVNLPAIHNQYAGAGQTASQAFAKAFQQDYIGDAFKAVQERAAQKAFERNQSVTTGDPSTTGAVAPGHTPQAGSPGGLSQGTDHYTKLIANLEKEIQTIEKRNQALGMTTAEQARLNAAYDLENQLKEHGIKLTPEQQVQMNQMLDTIQLTTQAFEDKKSMMEANQETMKQLQEVGKTAITSLQDGLNEFIETGKVDFENLIDSMLKQFAKLAAELLVIQPLMAAVTGGGSLSGGILSGVLGGFGGFFASGGQPPVGKWSIVGEKGPEIFVPKTAGTIYPSGTMPALPSGNVSQNITVSPVYNIDARGADSAQITVLRNELRQHKAGLKNEVLQAVQTAKRRYPGKF